MLPRWGHFGPIFALFARTPRAESTHSQTRNAKPPQSSTTTVISQDCASGFIMEPLWVIGGQRLLLWDVLGGWTAPMKVGTSLQLFGSGFWALSLRTEECPHLRETTNFPAMHLIIGRQMLGIQRCTRLGPDHASHFPKLKSARPPPLRKR